MAKSLPYSLVDTAYDASFDAANLDEVERRLAILRVLVNNPIALIERAARLLDGTAVRIL